MLLAYAAVRFASEAGSSRGTIFRRSWNVASTRVRSQGKCDDVQEIILNCVRRKWRRARQVCIRHAAGRQYRRESLAYFLSAHLLSSVVHGGYMRSEVHPVDEFLPVPKLLTLGLQHVLVMYAGAVAVPLIVGRALKMSSEEVAFLVSADLFACGLATLVQSIGFPGVGIRLPVMMGVTFASVGPMLSMAAAPDVGLLGIYGSVIGAGLFALVAAPFMSRLLPFFPPVVTGTIILVIGVSLMRIGINWAGGGLPTLTKVVDGVPGAFPNPSASRCSCLS
jgi:hypothetical protein